MLFVGFHKEQQKKMLQLKEKIVVQVINCEVKKSHNSEKLDVILKSCTEISESVVAIDVESIDEPCLKSMTKRISSG